MRHHGFDTKIVVFYPLPREKHRYLVEIEKQGIPISSLYDETALRSKLMALFLVVPWFLYILLAKRQVPDVKAFGNWIRNRCAVNHLSGKLKEESPDIIHVKGRLPTNAWAVFPPDRTIYHHALMGTVDPSWNEKEVEDFRVFAHRIACIFAPGSGVAETLAKEFRIERPIDPIFAMAPDEAGDQWSASSKQFEKRRREYPFWNTLQVYGAEGYFLHTVGVERFQGQVRRCGLYICRAG